MSKPEHTNWTFLTNHAHVLLCLATKDMRIRDIAIKVGITERAVQSIITDLSDSGYLDKIKDGRCNHYSIHTEKHLKHPIEAHRTIADFISLIHN